VQGAEWMEHVIVACFATPDLASQFPVAGMADRVPAIGRDGSAHLPAQSCLANHCLVIAVGPPVERVSYVIYPLTLRSSWIGIKWERPVQPWTGKTDMPG
jgi:hypothetical protein